MLALWARYHDVADGRWANSAQHVALHDDSGPLRPMHVGARLRRVPAAGAR